ncbi:MAG: hypothetical protein HOE90_02555 [Bacteriovoracaceae bacterium]|nr:hypothetical protein [Bacteriovoracaceae bacterium]
MKNLILAIFISVPGMASELDISRAITTKQRSATVSCLSNGSGGTPISISFSARHSGGALYSGVLTSVGNQFHVFNISLTNETTDATQIKFDFSGVSTPDISIKGSMYVDLKEIEVGGEKLKIPSGNGVIDLAVKPKLSTVVFDKYVLSDCVGMVK